MAAEDAGGSGDLAILVNTEMIPGYIGRTWRELFCSSGS